MKTKATIGTIALIGILLGTSGCFFTFNGKGGAFGALQEADEKIAQHYGVPVVLVQDARKVFGVPDARTLPGAERILPVEWMVTYDILDRNQSDKVVDASGFYRSAMPRIVPAGTATPTIFDSKTASGTSLPDLDKIIGFIKDNAGKLGK